MTIMVLNSLQTRVSSSPVAKIIDTKTGEVLKNSVYKPTVLLENRISLLNLHDMSNEYQVGNLKNQADYKNRYQVREIKPTDTYPVHLDRGIF